MKNKVLIAPSLLSSDFANLESEVKRCEKAGADVLHVDVMDGHFVPNITLGPLVVKAIKPNTSLPLDCHLMISEPDKYIEAFAEAGADYISIHAEASPHFHRSLSSIKDAGAKPGIALNPVTPLEYAFEAAEYADFILLMSVNPGFAAQEFINNFSRRAQKLRYFLDEVGLEHVRIQVDGGIKISNVAEVVESGADFIVSGSGLFKGNLEENIKKMKEEAQKGQ